ncbi:TetR/AcrR family transcriptional regulator [Rhodococcus sp. NPDC060090]|uniref:TetR/AcrR family transcriptional regulator n=1 Tax=Rhodococcus sp. NPDC060090 TaxID=3347056 RepID=UPI00364C73AD
MDTRLSFATARRTELFDGLVELFLAEGFAHLTLDAIAARLQCSKSTLYTLAGSKEQLVTAATKHFFKRATEQVEAKVAAAGTRDRIAAYLTAVGEALAAASEQFMNDLDAFAPAREVYERNTRIAARRVQELITLGVADGDFRGVNAEFAADLAATMMVRIQQGRVRAATGLDDANAYRELTSILTTGISV